jgi:hypothetical protein
MVVSQSTMITGKSRSSRPFCACMNLIVQIRWFLTVTGELEILIVHSLDYKKKRNA